MGHKSFRSLWHERKIPADAKWRYFSGRRARYEYHEQIIYMYVYIEAAGNIHGWMNKTSCYFLHLSAKRMWPEVEVARSLPQDWTCKSWRFTSAFFHRTYYPQMHPRPADLRAHWLPLVLANFAPQLKARAKVSRESQASHRFIIEAEVWAWLAGAFWRLPYWLRRQKRWRVCHQNMNDGSLLLLAPRYTAISPLRVVKLSPKIPD